MPQKHIKKDIKRRLNVYKNEKKNLLYKFLIRSTLFSNEIRQKYQSYFLSKHSINEYSKTRIKNYCIFTSRSKGINKNIKISRITFKKLISKGLLVGIKKSS